MFEINLNALLDKYAAIGKPPTTQVERRIDRLGILEVFEIKIFKTTKCMIHFYRLEFFNWNIFKISKREKKKQTEAKLLS